MWERDVECASLHVLRALLLTVYAAQVLQGSEHRPIPYSQEVSHREDQQLLSLDVNERKENFSPAAVRAEPECKRQYREIADRRMHSHCCRVHRFHLQGNCCLSTTKDAMAALAIGREQS